MWSPEQYLRFKNERKQPFLDLVAMVEPRPRMRAVDLGCGPGELTKELHETVGAAETLGIDSSDAMLRESDRYAGGGVHFAKGDIATFAPDERYDLIFSNAALHWVPDHERLLARLASFLTGDGQLAIQMPANDTHPSHVVAARVAREFRIEPRADFVLPPERYAELLHREGFTRQHVRLQVYGHLLPSAADVVEWVRGALLTAYEAQLDAARYAEFLAVYRRELAREIGDGAPFFYTYKRVLFHARRG